MCILREDTDAALEAIVAMDGVGVKQHAALDQTPGAGVRLVELWDRLYPDVLAAAPS